MNNTQSALTPIEPARPSETNWQLHVDANQRLWAIPITPGAKKSHFGDKHHILRLARDGHFDLTRLNDAGRELLSGLRSQLIGAEKRVPLLTF